MAVIPFVNLSAIMLLGHSMRWPPHHVLAVFDVLAHQQPYRIELLTQVVYSVH